MDTMRLVTLFEAMNSCLMHIESNFPLDPDLGNRLLDITIR